MQQRYGLRSGWVLPSCPSSGHAESDTHMRLSLLQLRRKYHSSSTGSRYTMRVRFGYQQNTVMPTTPVRHGCS